LKYFVERNDFISINKPVQAPPESLLINVDIQSERERVVSAPPGFICDMVEQNPEPSVTNFMQMEAACQIPNESPCWGVEV
jgi:hypothetical protein